MQLNLVTRTILERLQHTSGDVSGEALCRDLGISRAAVWKHIQTLRGLGYGIDSATQRGYCLRRSANFPYPWEIRPFLKTSFCGWQIQYLPTVDSTNRAAAEAAGGGAEEGTCVIADQQSRGRGRMWRKWHSPAGGNLYLSMVLRPAVAPVAVSQLSLVTALAGRRVLQSMLPDSEVRIKWPNDLFVDGGKTAGILCESSAELDRVHHVVIGIGINVNTPREEFSGQTDNPVNSMLSANHGREFSRPMLAAELLNHFEPLYLHWGQRGLGELLEEMERYSLLAGREVQVTNGEHIVRGRVLGISHDGGLRLQPRKSCGEVVVHCGDTRILSW